jgi:glycosyltransferase involved in cell wall biosynthesis
VGAALISGYGLPYHRAAFRVARGAGYPLLFRGESTDHAISRSVWKSWLRDAYLRLYYARFSKLLYIGQHSLDHFRRVGYGRRENLAFSPYCVDTASFRCGEDHRSVMRASVRRDIAAGEHQKVLLYSGKLSPRKGPDLLVSAVGALEPELRSGVVGVFLGSGEMSETLERQARASGVQVRFPGFRNQTELSPWYHASDLLVLPSVRSETWGLVVNEAMHHGVPCVVSTSVGSAPDLISPGRTGEIFESGSVDGLESALLRGFRLVGNPDVRSACRERAGRYTVATAAEGIAKAYHDVVGSEARQAGTGG